MTGAHIAAHAAAEAKKQRDYEEEHMSGYSAEELRGDWEFKIIRSATSVFKRPEVMNAVLQEEQVGGWELVEKFDDGRIHLKRAKSARENDAMLPRGYNAYRTQYGISEGGLVIWVLLSIGLTVGLILGVVFLVNGSL